MSQNNIAYDWSVHFPGQAVPIPGSDQVVSVYPIGLEHLQAHGDKLAQMITTMKLIDIPEGATREDLLGALALKLAPLLLGSGIDLLDSCCRPSIKGAPASLQLACLKAFIVQTLKGVDSNFLKGLGATIRAAILARCYLTSVSASARSSAPDSLSVKSSTDGNPDTTGDRFLTGDGATGS